VLIAAFLLLGAVAISALASADARRVVGNCTKSQVRPAAIIIACADDNLSLTRLHWSSFGATTAHGSGEYYVNDCTPDCAGGAVSLLPDQTRPFERQAVPRRPRRLSQRDDQLHLDAAPRPALSPQPTGSQLSVAGLDRRSVDGGDVNA
jgi:hypothetical protein